MGSFVIFLLRRYYVGGDFEAPLSNLSGPHTYPTYEFCLFHTEVVDGVISIDGVGNLGRGGGDAV